MKSSIADPNTSNALRSVAVAVPLAAILSFPVWLAPAHIEFKDFGATDVIQLLTIPFVVALLAERALEVFVGTWRMRRTPPRSASWARSPRARGTRPRPTGTASTARRARAAPSASAEPLAVRAPIALAHAEVVHRQDVGTSEGEDQEHLDGPPADAADAQQPLDDRLVVQPRGRPPRRHRAGQRVAGDVLDRAHLGAREAGAAQSRGVRGRDVRRRGEAPVAEERHEAGEDRLRGPAVELLVGDGAGQRLVGRPAPALEAARPVAPDEPAHDRIPREVAVRARCHRGRTRHR